MALEYTIRGEKLGLDEALERAFRGELPWDRELVRRGIWRAARALSALRSLGARDYPADRAAYWPEVVFTVEERLNREKDTANRVRPAPPSPAEIDRMDAAISWLLPLTRHERRLVFAKAALKGCAWSWLGKQYGVSRDTAKRQHRRAIDAIVARLRSERGEKKVA